MAQIWMDFKCFRLNFALTCSRVFYRKFKLLSLCVVIHAISSVEFLKLLDINIEDMAREHYEDISKTLI